LEDDFDPLELLELLGELLKTPEAVVIEMLEDWAQVCLGVAVQLHHWVVVKKAAF